MGYTKMNSTCNSSVAILRKDIKNIMLMKS